MDWQTVERIFDEALDQPVDHRERFIRERAGDDEALRRELLSLLSAEADSSSFLERDSEEPAAVAIRKRFGAWEVVAPLGQGGMGEVYRVERADGEYRQQAALKLMRPLPESYWARFQRERQILAELEHAGIARLLDGGLSEDRRPFMVIEYVQGAAIDAWAGAHKLDAAARVRLVIEVADAVAHAHAKLVVHRDIKPSNILVTEDGRTRLIDFGIAHGMTVEATGATDTPLSIEYAAPELLEGRSASVATDVYGLGATLFELLTGRPPVEVDGLAMAMALRRVIDTPPPRLSASPLAMAIPPTLKGDLDAILAKTLRKEPEARYATVNGFTEDLSRALAGEPVSARRGERGYAAARFLRRQKWPIAAAAAITLTLAGGLAASLWQADEARRQRDAALREQARLEAVQQYLYFMLRSAAETGGTAGGPAKTLETAATRVIELFDRDPGRGGPVMHTLGELYFYLDDYTAAEPLLRRLSEATGVDPSLAASASYDLAQVRLRQADAQEAARLLAHAQAYWRTDERRWRSKLVDSRLVEARLLRDQGRVEAAVQLLKDNLPARIAISGPNHRETGVYHNDLGVMLTAAGRPDEAVIAYQAAMGVWVLTGLESSPDALNTLNNLASLYVLSGRPAQAEPLFRRAVALRRSLYGPSAATAALLSNHGKTLQQLGRSDNALAPLLEATAMAREHAGVGSLHFASAAAGLSEVRLALGQRAEADRLAREALKDVTAALGPQHPATAVLQIAQARVWAANGRSADAARLLGQAEATIAKLGKGGAAQVSAIDQIRTRYDLRR